MQAIKLRSASFVDWVRGPYRKRGRPALCVQTDTSQTEVALDLARSGVELLSGVFVSVHSGKLFIELEDPTAKLTQLGVIGSNVLFDGSKLKIEGAEPRKKLVFSVSNRSTLRVEASGKQVVFALGFAPAESAEIEVDRTQVARTRRENIRAWLQAIGVHALVFAFIVLIGRGVLLEWIGGETNLAQIIEQQTPQDVAQPVPVEVAVPDASEFAGHGLMQTPSAEQVQKQAQKITANLSQVVAKMGKLSMGEIAKNQGGQAAQNSGALSALREKLAALRATDTAGAFKFVGHGGAANQNWDLYGSAAAEYSAKDLEHAGEVFRGLQEHIRGCYESALLKFETMSVVVTFEATIASDGHIGEPTYGLSGSSTPESEAVLKSCLTKVLRRGAFGSKLSGARLKNQFIFRS